ncbi:MULTISPECIES: response regulator [Microvirga]|uniref:response regulator n=1 Tax=Microvirga TaxID=186650 RepID=UPI001FFCE1DA|nr:MULTISPECIES: response regulator [unclassified Microvirga]
MLELGSLSFCKGLALSVEDEPLVRLIAADILVDANFRVIEASNSEEALTVPRAGVEVDVLLSAADMPHGINGYELARRTHGCWQTVEILITYGR